MPNDRDRGRGRGGGRMRGPVSRDVQISKNLSYLLRHGARKEDVPMDEGGWVNVRDVLQWHKIRSLKVTFAEIDSVVKTNDKQRFTLHQISDAPHSAISPPTSPRRSGSAVAGGGNTAGIGYAIDPSQYRIRASQGHSLQDLDDSLMLAPIHPTDPECPNVVVHGTFQDKWRLIQESGGLKPMNRRHVHFALDVPPAMAPLQKGNDRENFVDRGEENGVVSGMRKDATICVWVDVKKSMSEGMVWWRGANGVILTEGIGGLVKLDNFAWVEWRGKNIVLFGDRETGMQMRAEQRQRKVEQKLFQKPEVAPVDQMKNLDLEKETVGASARKVKKKDYLNAEVKENWDDSAEGSPEPE